MTHLPARAAGVIVPSEWAEFYEATNIPAAVRSGATLRLTGHTGDVDGRFDPDPESQIRATFHNIGLTLAAAGAGWGDVVELTSYHIGFGQQSPLVLRVVAEFLDAPFPAWTAVGVTELFEPDALVEISCVAVLPE